MARGFPWFRFWSDMHGKGKIAALSDAEFRLLTRLWALARQSEEPGVVYVAPGVGWAPEDLAKTAGCKSREKPQAMLKRLEQLTCIRVRPDGVIEVHDWEEHNPPQSPSKTPAARAEQKRRERAGGRQPVGRRHDGDNGATGQAGTSTDPDPELDPEEETDPEPASRSEQRPAGWLEAISQTLTERLGAEKPLGVGRDRARVEASFARFLDRGLEQELLDDCVTLAREKGVIPSHLSWWPGWLDTVTDARLDADARRRAEART